MIQQISATDRAMLAKLLGLVGSDHDGEALSAARKAHDLLRAKGATWSDLLGLDTIPAEPHHVGVARELLSRGKGICTDWEMRFLRGVLGFKTLSTHQRQTLDGIREKVDAAVDFSPHTE